MGCCGRQRAQVVSTAPAPASRRDPLRFAPLPASHRTRFQYIGRTALTAIGRATGRTYRFGKSGEVQEVDPRDRASLLGVPLLREV
jgi:hypothetical protein